MKAHNAQVAAKNFNADMKNKRPENKDDLDSREREEQHAKGEHVTHNKKDHHSEGKSDS